MTELLVGTKKGLFLLEESGGEIGDIHRPCAAQFQVGDGLGREHGQLGLGIRGNLVGEPAEGDGH